MNRSALTLTLILAVLGAPNGHAADPIPPPAQGRPAPLFTLTDTAGKARALVADRGHPVTLFFFCGCPWCARCAHDWSQFQHGGALPLSGGRTPETLVVFSGDGAAARAFAEKTGLAPARTVLLPDAAMHVTLDLYRAEPCPRVFVLDAKGIVRYTNDHRDDAARQAPEMVIASRALDALRACRPGPQPSSAKPQ